MTEMKFIEDWDPDTEYDAVSFGPRWNGWATPVVTKETLVKMGERYAAEGGNAEGLWELTWDGDTAVWSFEPEDSWRMEPNQDGNYDLGQMGFCYVTV